MSMILISARATLMRIAVGSVLCVTNACTLGDGPESPMKLVDECTADFDKNGRSDRALLLDRDGEITLTVFLRENGDYESYLLRKTRSRWLRAKCESGHELTETLAGVGKRNAKKV